MYRLAAYLFFASTANAATLFGPTPYLSQSDSPFNLSGLGSTFFLEDFEDGLINTTGIRLSVPSDAAVLSPRDTADSVDADDGIIDGSGRNGYSLVDTGAVIFPPWYVRTIELVFDADALGFQPTAFGFVWTDGPPGSWISLLWINGDGRQMGHTFERTRENGLGDNRDDGDSAEDRFFGVRDDNGIDFVIINSSNFLDSRTFEIDHVQYGLFVPEPSIAMTISSALLSVMLFAFRGFPFDPKGAPHLG